MTSEALERFARHLAEGGPVDPGIRLVSEGDLRLWLGNGTGAYENTAVYCGGPEPDAVRAAIARSQAFFAEAGRGFEFKFTAWNMPAETPTQLMAQGFVPGEPEVVMALPVQTVVLPAPKEQIALRELTEPADFAAIARLQQSIWQADFGWLTEGLQREKQAQPRALLLYGVEESGQLVAAAWMRIEADLAFFHGGTTAPAWRGKGLYRELVHARLRRAKQLKLAWAFTEAVPASLPILQKMGFEPVGETRPFFLAGPA